MSQYCPNCESLTAENERLRSLVEELAVDLDLTERIAQAIADRRGSKVVQHFHREDAKAAVAAIKAAPRPAPSSAEKRATDTNGAV